MPVLRYAARHLLKWPGIHPRRDSRPRARHRCQHRAVQRRELSLSPAAALSRTGSLVQLSSTNEATNVMRDRFSYARYLEVQQRQQVFSDVALSVGNVFTLTGRGDLEQLHGAARVSGAAARTRTRAGAR